MRMLALLIWLTGLALAAAAHGPAPQEPDAPILGVPGSDAGRHLTLRQMGYVLDWGGFPDAAGRWFDLTKVTGLGPIRQQTGQRWRKAGSRMMYALDYKSACILVPEREQDIGPLGQARHLRSFWYKRQNAWERQTRKSPWAWPIAAPWFVVSLLGESTWHVATRTLWWAPAGAIVTTWTAGTLATAGVAWPVGQSAFALVWGVPNALATTVPRQPSTAAGRVRLGSEIPLVQGSQAWRDVLEEYSRWAMQIDSLAAALATPLPPDSLAWLDARSAAEHQQLDALCDRQTQAYRRAKQDSRTRPETLLELEFQRDTTQARLVALRPDMNGPWIPTERAKRQRIAAHWPKAVALWQAGQPAERAQLAPLPSSTVSRSDLVHLTRGSLLLQVGAPLYLHPATGGWPCPPGRRRSVDGTRAQGQP